MLLFLLSCSKSGFCRMFHFRLAWRLRRAPRLFQNGKGNSLCKEKSIKLYMCTWESPMHTTPRSYSTSSCASCSTQIRHKSFSDHSSHAKSITYIHIYMGGQVGCHIHQYFDYLAHSKSIDVVPSLDAYWCRACEWTACDCSFCLYLWYVVIYIVSWHTTLFSDVNLYSRYSCCSVKRSISHSEKNLVLLLNEHHAE